MVLAIGAALRVMPVVAEPPLPWNPKPPGHFREIWPVDAESEAELLAQLGEPYEILHTDHFSLAHASRDGLARYRGQILESIYAAFVLFFDSGGFELEKPDSLLEVVLFQTRDEFALRVGLSDLPDEIEGLYRADRSRAYFFDALGRNTNRHADEALRDREQELKKMQRRARRSSRDSVWKWQQPTRPVRRVPRDELLRLIARELRTLHYGSRDFRESLGQSSLETMCHEGVHQLAHEMGVLRPDRPNPRWLSEGLAVFFEPSRNGFLLETGEVHWRRWDVLTKAHQRGERIPLRELLTKDDLFFEWSAADLAYNEAWSLVHFLAKEKKAELMNYLRALRQVEPGSPTTARIVLFEETFGAPLADLEPRWQAHVAGLGTPSTPSP